VNNLAQLLHDRRQRFADRRIGVVGDHESFADAYDRAARLAARLDALGVRPGQTTAVIGTSSRAYLTTWMALQLAGAETALVNPSYPSELLADMLADLQPHAVVWVGVPVDIGVAARAVHVDASMAADGVLVVDDDRHDGLDPDGPLPGLARAGSDIAGYMHTSGTTGTPKFCAQTHEYFLRLGRFIADAMGLCDSDTVFAPLPLFHINPLGYGVIGGLIAGSSVLGAAKFSASRFWSDVRDNGVTAMVLHAPPVEILKRATSTRDAAGHRVRIVFFADAEFLERFEIPLGVSAYGSTEAGGLCHVWLWRRGEHPDLPEGMSRYGGRSRHDVEWRIRDGEIEVRARRPGVMFDGYRRRGELIRPFDADGWFATGDLGRIDDAGNLVFIERRAESIRVKGEFVPIGFVEDHFAKLDGIDDLAIWRQDSDLVDDEIALFVAGAAVDIEAIRTARSQLPAFMQPTVMVRVAAIPRDAGVGKVRRRELCDAQRIETLALS
jgi:carnitine-CoA ligase